MAAGISHWFGAATGFLRHVPNDEEYVWLVDLNKDGEQDILLHDPFTLRDAHGARRRPPGTEPHRVNMLIAR